MRFAVHKADGRPHHGRTSCWDFNSQGAILVTLLLVALAPPATAAAAVQTPAFAWFTPDHGPVGTHVKIGGYRFTGATHVRFSGVDASFTVTSSQTIDATVPARATNGPPSVSTPSGTTTTTS